MRVRPCSTWLAEQLDLPRFWSFFYFLPWPRFWPLFGFLPWWGISMDNCIFFYYNELSTIITIMQKASNDVCFKWNCIQLLEYAGEAQSKYNRLGEPENSGQCHKTFSLSLSYSSSFIDRVLHFIQLNIVLVIFVKLQTKYNFIKTACQKELGYLLLMCLVP